MKIKILFSTLMTLALGAASYAQTLDKAKLDPYLGTGYTDVNKNESFSHKNLGDWQQETDTY